MHTQLYRDAVYFTQSLLQKKHHLCSETVEEVMPSEQFSHSVIYMYFFLQNVLSLKLNKYKKTDEMAQCFFFPFKNNKRSVIFTKLYIMIISRTHGASA